MTDTTTNADFEEPFIDVSLDRSAAPPLDGLTVFSESSFAFLFSDTSQAAYPDIAVQSAARLSSSASLCTHIRDFDRRIDAIMLDRID